MLSMGAFQTTIFRFHHKCEDTLTSLCSQQCCMHVAMEILQERAPLPQACAVFLTKYGVMTLMSNPSQLYQEVGDSKVQFSCSQLLHQLIENNL